MKQAKYNKEDRCPLCGSNNICWGERHQEGYDYVSYKAECNDCKATWEDFHQDKDGNEYETKEEE